MPLRGHGSESDRRRMGEMGDEQAENNEYVNIRRRVEFRIDLEKQ